MSLDQTDRLITALDRTADKLDNLYEIISNNFSTDEEGNLQKNSKGFTVEWDTEDLGEKDTENIEQGGVDPFPPINRQNPTETLFEAANEFTRLRSALTDPTFQKLKELIIQA